MNYDDDILMCGRELTVYLTAGKPMKPLTMDLSNPTPAPWKIEQMGILEGGHVRLFGLRQSTQGDGEKDAALMEAAPRMFPFVRYLASLPIETCPRCGGSGESNHCPGEACGQCGGTGKDTGNPDPTSISTARELLAELEGRLK